MNYIDLGSRIRKLRKHQNLTQEALAERVNVSTSFISHVERGSRKASLETLVGISNALSVSTDYLLSGSLNHTVAGPMPARLTAKEKAAMKAILDILEEAVA